VSATKGKPTFAETFSGAGAKGTPQLSSKITGKETRGAAALIKAPRKDESAVRSPKREATDLVAQIRAARSQKSRR